MKQMAVYNKSEEKWSIKQNEIEKQELNRVWEFNRVSKWEKGKKKEGKSKKGKTKNKPKKKRD